MPVILRCLKISNYRFQAGEKMGRGVRSHGASVAPIYEKRHKFTAVFKGVYGLKPPPPPNVGENVPQHAF